MPGKAVNSLTTGLEDTETVTVANLVAVGAAETGRSTLIVPGQGSGTPRPRRHGRHHLQLLTGH